jgi:ParB-like chromosome segregation protein Spo0J
MPKTALKDENVDQVDFLKRSPIHGIKPVAEREIELSLIDEDPSNPGSDKFSKRYDRRAPDIRESFDIIGGIVYPLVVCEKGDASGRYTIIDGHGRGDEAKRRGEKKMRVIIFPPLTLEKRICLREVLNAAQEPFDSPLVLKDLSLLAEERGLDIRNDNDLESLLADLPASIRNHRKKLKLLAKWPSEVANKIGVDDNAEAGVIGLDKVKELDLLVGSVKKNHPETAKLFLGDKLQKQVLKLYFNGTFRDGGRSQDTIRDVNRILKKLPQDHPSTKKFLKGSLSLGEFKAETELELSDRTGRDGLVGLCKDLNALLTDVDALHLTAAERRSLKRTAELASQVLSEVQSV